MIGGRVIPLMDDGRVFCAEMGCEYGAAVIIICGLWLGTMPGCCRLPGAGCDEGAVRVAGIDASLVPTGWVRLAAAGCSWGLRHRFCM